MSLNDLPSSIQSVIQQGYLERKFREPLQARLGFRSIADREPFTAGVGESITKTRTGLLAAVTTPMAPAAVTDITSGLTNQNYAVEQYILSIAQYPGTMQLNMSTSKVAIASLFLRNAWTLGEQAYRSVDTIAQFALYGAYAGGNTRVTATLGAPGTTVHVDDVRGFITTLNAQGAPVPISSSFPVNVVVNLNTYVLSGVLADGTAPAQIPSWIANLPFSGTSSNSSTTPGGYSGVLTFTTNVTVADGTLGNTVTSAVAPFVQRPYITSSGLMVANTSLINQANDNNNARLTMQMVLNAKATMNANNVPPVDASGMYHCYADPIQMTGLFQDPAFQLFFRGQDKSTEFKMGVVSETMGVKFIETNLNPVQTLAGVGTVRRAIIVGQGALVEGCFTRTGYEAANAVDDGNMTTIVDDIAHITREPIDALKQVITQSWSYIGGFTAPTDTTANSTNIPTANNSAYKRGIIIESL